MLWGSCCFRTWLFSLPKERVKIEVGHSKLVDGRSKKQGNLLRLSWVAERGVDLYPCLPSLKSVYKGLNWVVRYAVQMVSATPYFLKVFFLGRAPTVGVVGRGYIPRTGEWLPESSSKTSGHSLPILSFNRRPKFCLQSVPGWRSKIPQAKSHAWKRDTGFSPKLWPQTLGKREIPSQSADLDENRWVFLFQNS